jgi:hypothetical protein
MIFQELQDPGVIGVVGDGRGLVTAPGAGMVIDVAAVRLWARGYVVQIGTARRLDVPPADDEFPRWDRVVVYVDPTTNSGVLTIRPGTPGVDPLEGIAPLRGTGVDAFSGFDLPLGRYPVPPNAVNIAPGSAVDERNWTSGRVGQWSTSSRPTAATGLLRPWRFGVNTTRKAPEFWVQTGANLEDGAWVGLDTEVDDHPWARIALAAPLTHLTTGGYNGVQVARVGRMVTLAGAFTHPSAPPTGIPAGTLIGTIPVGMRPATRVDAQTNNGNPVTIMPDGTVTLGTVAASTLAIVTTSWPLIGTTGLAAGSWTITSARPV